ncbi:MAG: thioredoxin family protein [Desulfobacterales bacterium]|nr:thioredoxin family protein [Desulfobacterales bacterium]
MKKICVILLVLIFQFIGFNACASETQPNTASTTQSIQWKTYDEGLAQGKKEKKKIFLYFYASWCGYCRKMDNESFKQENIISYLNKHFIPIRINTDNDTKIPAVYGVRGLPANWFLTEEGEKIGQQPGYIPAATLRPFLEYIDTDKYKQMSFQEFMKSK